MNYKLEKFWNARENFKNTELEIMNYKLEKFWNNKYSAFLIKVKTMNYKLEKFWNRDGSYGMILKGRWTINLKSFEIIPSLLKLEKFWNYSITPYSTVAINMNYKLEKFWNGARSLILVTSYIWTINLKSFEILWLYLMNYKHSMNYKLEKFWNFASGSGGMVWEKMNYKLEKFWNKKI